jgi:flagella basal body P-ring formation protein FlgA
MRARRIVVAALVLAWATHLLVTQWVNADSPAPGPTGVVVQMRERAVVTGPRIALADVCRLAWTGLEVPAGDGGPIGESLLMEAPAGRATLEVGIDQVLRVLGEAGVSAADIRLEGAVRCVVTIAEDPKSDEAGLLEWAGVAGAPATRPATRPSPVAALSEPAEVDFVGPAGSLGEVLKLDLASRLELPAGAIQLAMAPDDARFALRTDVAASHVRPLKVDDLGPVAWAVTIDGVETELHAQAAAMVTRAVAAGPLGTGHVIREQDLSEQRVRIARLEERGMAVEEAIGQQTVGPWKEGEALTARRLVPWMLVREGEFVTVHLVRNGIEISVLARALEKGAYGQVIRATSEVTGQEMLIRLTAPQVGRMVEPGSERR